MCSSDLWTTPDVTPVIAGYSNYWFTLTAAVARPRIIFDNSFADGESISTYQNSSTNNLYVGEQFEVSLQLGSVAQYATAFNWQLPVVHEVIKNFNFDFTGSRINPFAYGVDNTQRNVSCYFTSPFTNKSVTVVATVVDLVITQSFQIGRAHV